jgi:hypothetical protein
MVSSKKKWTVVNPIPRRMKKCKASSGQNDQLLHWWLLAEHVDIQFNNFLEGAL